MNAPLHPDPDDLVLYCMQSLDSAGTAQIRAHLQECVECAATAAAFQMDMGLLAMASPSATPPPEARQRLLQAAAAETAAKVKPIAAVTKEIPASNLASFPPRRKPIALWLGWAVAAASIFYVVHVRKMNHDLRTMARTEAAQLLQLDQANARAQEILDVLTSPEAQNVALVPGKAAPQPSGHAVYLKDRGALVFTATNMAALPPNKTYELWVIPANGSAPIPAGTFAPDTRGSASVLLPKLPVGVEAKAFGVTMENEGGSTTPTMPILMAGS
ncbi:MAG TPA: anti-sigma factor [Acidobacteriaceae bacterium]|jgi:hypothetical protein|nr:anti-sigma factor [Acidobacteriaceae bacterium]